MVTSRWCQGVLWHCITSYLPIQVYENRHEKDGLTARVVSMGESLEARDRKLKTTEDSVQFLQVQVRFLVGHFLYISLCHWYNNRSNYRSCVRPGQIAKQSGPFKVRKEQQVISNQPCVMICHTFPRKCPFMERRLHQMTSNQDNPFS